MTTKKRQQRQQADSGFIRGLRSFLGYGGTGTHGQPGRLTVNIQNSNLNSLGSRGSTPSSTSGSTPGSTPPISPAALSPAYTPAASPSASKSFSDPIIPNSSTVDLVTPTSRETKPNPPIPSSDTPEPEGLWGKLNQLLTIANEQTVRVNQELYDIFINDKIENKTDKDTEYKHMSKHFNLVVLPFFLPIDVNAQTRGLEGGRRTKSKKRGTQKGGTDDYEGLHSLALACVNKSEENVIYNKVDPKLKARVHAVMSDHRDSLDNISVAANNLLHNPPAEPSGDKTLKQFQKNCNDQLRSYNVPPPLLPGQPGTSADLLPPPVIPQHANNEQRNAYIFYIASAMLELVRHINKTRARYFDGTRIEITLEHGTTLNFLIRNLGENGKIDYSLQYYETFEFQSESLQNAASQFKSELNRNATLSQTLLPQELATQASNEQASIELEDVSELKEPSSFWAGKIQSIHTSRQKIITAVKSLDMLKRIVTNYYYDIADKVRIQHFQIREFVTVRNIHFLYGDKDLDVLQEEYGKAAKAVIAANGKAANAPQPKPQGKVANAAQAKVAKPAANAPQPPPEEIAKGISMIRKAQSKRVAQIDGMLIQFAQANNAQDKEKIQNAMRELLQEMNRDQEILRELQGKAPIAQGAVPPTSSPTEFKDAIPTLKILLEQEQEPVPANAQTQSQSQADTILNPGNINSPHYLLDLVCKLVDPNEMIKFT